MSEGEQGHFQSGEAEPTLAEIIEAMPDNFIAYCWQLFIKRITEHKGLSEEEAKKMMLEQILEFAQHPEKIPPNPPQVYPLKEEAASIPLCKEELLQYVKGTFDLAKSHLSKYYEELQFFSPPELTAEMVQQLEEKIRVADMFFERIFKMYHELYQTQPDQIPSLDALIDPVHRLHFMIIDMKTTKKATTGKQYLNQIKTVDRALSILERAEKKIKKFDSHR